MLCLDLEERAAETKLVYGNIKIQFQPGSIESSGKLDSQSVWGFEAQRNENPR